MKTLYRIDWDAARARVEFAGDALGIPEAEVRRVMHASDEELNGDVCESPVIQFGIKHHVSLQWLMDGDVSGLLRAYAYHSEREERGRR